jgi:protein translocase subunit secY/sec61 alpha
MANRNNTAPSGGLNELKQRILFLLGAIVVYRLGTHIPVPGVDPAALAQLFNQTRGSIVDIFNMFSGGALSRLSVFALGVMPYISASIIMQMLSTIVPSLEQIKKEGDAGRRKIAQYTRYLTIILATFQGIGITTLIEGQQVNGTSVILISGLSFKISAVACLVAGTMFLVWLGEQITERGIGNGISLIIFASIVSGLPAAIGGTFELVSNGSFSSIGMILLILGAIAVIFFAFLWKEGKDESWSIMHNDNKVVV